MKLQWVVILLIFIAGCDNKPNEELRELSASMDECIALACALADANGVIHLNSEAVDISSNDDVIFEIEGETNE